MEITFPDGFHGHQHGALDNAVNQGWNTQGPLSAIGFGNIDPLDRLRAIGARQKLLPQTIQIVTQIILQVLLIHSINARRSGTTGRQNNTSSLGKPDPVDNKPQQTIKPTVWIICGPHCEFVLHFADYQRSSPYSVR